LEITQFLWALRRRLTTLVGVVVAAALIAGLYLVVQPQKYTAKVDTSIPASVLKTASSASVGQYVANFSAVLTSEPVVRDVALGDHVSESSLSGGLSVSQIGSSGLLEVSYTGTNASTASKIVSHATAATIDRVGGPLLDSSHAATADAQAKYDAARGALEAFVAKTGQALPDEAYKAKLGQVSQMSVSLEDAGSSGFAARVGQIKADIAVAQQQLATLTPQVLQYERLQDAITQASNQLNAAATAEAQAKSDLAIQRAQMAVEHPTAISKLTTVGKGVLVVAAIAALLGALATVLLELLRSPDTTEELGADEVPQPVAPLPPPLPAPQVPAPASGQLRYDTAPSVGRVQRAVSQRPTDADESTRAAPADGGNGGSDRGHRAPAADPSFPARAWDTPELA
jgi:hypothetical protein